MEVLRAISKKKQIPPGPFEKSPYHFWAFCRSAFSYDMKILNQKLLEECSFLIKCRGHYYMSRGFFQDGSLNNASFVTIIFRMFINSKCSLFPFSIDEHSEKNGYERGII